MMFFIIIWIILGLALLAFFYGANRNKPCELSESELSASTLFEEIREFQKLNDKFIEATVRYDIDNLVNYYWKLNDMKINILRKLDIPKDVIKKE